MLIPLPLILLISTWWFTRGGEKEESTSGYLLEYYKSHYFQDFFMRFRIVVFDNFQLRQGAAGLIIAGVIFSLILIPIVYFKPWKTKSVLSLLLPSYAYPIIFFLTGFVCYMILPDQLPGQAPLFQRFCTIVILAFIIFSSVWLNHIDSKVFKYFVIGSITIYSALWFEYIFSFNKINASFNAELFREIPNTSRMAGLIYDHKYRGRKVYIHFPNYFVVWNQGVAASKIIDYRFGVVRRVALESEVPFYNEYVGDGYKAIRDYKKLEYLLVKGEAPVATDENVSGFRLIRKSGHWKVYERNDQ
jgi:hypothetical protein